jgi:hypothetical protein
MQTDTPDIFDWAINWIQECQKKHEKCNNNFVPESSDHYLPLRLLDVGGHEDETISLRLSSQLRREHPKDYIALSHCWGEAVNLTLTKSNIDNMENLHISSLTKNFQHAVRIARALNIRYLWIDSLCIVQDDDVEWESESANMGLVYANSKCVVSASASKDSNGGCFTPKELFRNDCTLRGSTEGSIVVKASSNTSFEASLKLFTDKAENTVLNTRAWTFQERYLARRVLHFCEGAVFFECNELVAHDGERYTGSRYPVRAGVRYDGTLHPPDEYEAVQRPVEGFTTASLPGRARPSATQQSENQQYTEQKKKMEKLLAMSARSGMRGAFELLWRFKGTTLAEKVEFHQSWFEMVEKYSARKLTRGTDKLKAMSGIAYFVQKNTTLQYSAGLWKEMLAFNLLWISCNPPDERPVRNIPSWSWGSVDGQISHRLKVSELPKESEETNNTPQPRQFESTWKKIIPLISEEKVQATEQVNDLILDAKLSVKGYLHSSTSHHVNTIYDVLFPNLPSQLIYLPVLAFENAEVHPMGSKIQAHGLVLRPNSDECETYERIGYFWTANDAVVEQMLSQPSQKKLILLV